MQVTRSSYDFKLTIDSVDYPFFLAKDANGVKQWNDGLAPMLAPQVRTTGFGYEHIPPDIEVIESTEGFPGGAGYSFTDSNRTVYNYARGLDTSWEDRILVSLKQNTILESDGTAIAAAPTKLFYSSLGLFLLAGAYIYEYDLSTTRWIQRDNASGDSTSYTDIIELDSVLYAARGDSKDYKFSSDGITWTAFTDADENAKVFAVRGNGSYVASLWKVKGNVVKTTTNGVNGGVAWAGSDEVGHTGETVQSAVTVDNDIFIFKREGIYSYNGTGTNTVWTTQFVETNNGKGAYVHANGNIYTAYGKRLLEYSPYGDTSLSPVYPPDSTGIWFDSSELRGDITAIGGDETHLYIALKNADGNTYILKGRANGNTGFWSWHSVLYLGANDCNAILLTGVGVGHTTNPVLFLGYGTGSRYVILPRQGIPPTEDSTCRFDTTVGVLYGSYNDFGAKTFTKFLNRGLLLGTGISSGRPATLSYERDRDGDQFDLVFATSDNLTEENETRNSFYLLRPILSMSTGDEVASPHVDAFAFSATLNPRRKRIWNPVIVLSDTQEFRGGGDTDIIPSTDVMRRVLFGAVTKRITMTDRSGVEYIVRLLDIQPVQLHESNFGGVERDLLAYQITLVGIQETVPTDQPTAIYDESTYDSPAVYS